MGALTKPTYSMIYGQPVSVMDFGAYGDGQHDDTAAIQAAIDAAGRQLPDTFPPSVQMNTNTRPPVVFIPPGTYRLTGTLNLYTGMTLMGINDLAYTVENTRLIMDTATNAAVATGSEPGGVVNLNKPILNLTRTYIPTGTQLSNNVTVGIENIGFWIVNPSGTIAQRGGIGWPVGPNELGSGGDGCAIYCSEDMIDTRIKRCNFYSMPNAAIWIDGTASTPRITSSFQVHECEFDTPIVDLRLEHTNLGLICSDSLFFGGSFQVYGDDVGGTFQSVGCQYSYSARLKFAPCDFDQFVFTGNLHEGAGSNGSQTALDINGAKQVTISGNHFGLSVASGVNLVNVLGGTVANNTFVDNGYNASPVSPITLSHGAIRLAGCQNVVVEGNSILTPDSATYNNFGIFSLDGTLPSKNVISNNFVSGAYNGAEYRGQPRRINVSPTDVVNDNYTGDPTTTTPEWRIHDGFGGRISLYRQGVVSTSSYQEVSLAYLSSAKVNCYFVAQSTADFAMFDVFIGRVYTTGLLTILNVSKNGVAAAGNGPHTISPGPNTITFSISGDYLRITYSLATDPILTSTQVVGSKNLNT